jgi:hypothetical protein
VALLSYLLAWTSIGKLAPSTKPVRICNGYALSVATNPAALCMHAVSCVWFQSALHEQQILCNNTIALPLFDVAAHCAF